MYARGHEDLPFHALPKIVARNEWELHLCEVHGSVERLLQRVAKLEAEGRHTGTELISLHGSCQHQLTSKRDFLETKDQLAQEMVDRQTYIERSAHGLREYVSSEIIRAREEIGVELEHLRNSIEGAWEEAARINNSLNEHVARADATYATGNELQTHVQDLHHCIEVSSMELQEALTATNHDKASRQELADAHTAITTAHTVLNAEHHETFLMLRNVEEQVVEIQRVCRDDLAKRVKLESAIEAIEQLSVRADAALSERELLKSDLSTEVARLTQCLSEQVDHTRIIDELGRKHSGLSSEVTSMDNDFAARCECLGRDLKALDRRERDSWEQFFSDRR